jgi:protein-disulfide isomerase
MTRSRDPTGAGARSQPVVYWLVMRYRLHASILATALLATACSAAAQTPLLPVRGAADGKIVLMVFADLSSPDGAKAEPVLAAVRQQFPKDVQVVFKHNPAPGKPEALLTHEAAAEAARQGKFWEMYDRLLANQAGQQRDQLIAHATALGLDAGAFAKALDGRTHRAVVERDMAEARALGVEGAYVLFINGRRGAGVPPQNALSGLIQNLLAGGDGSGPAPVPANTFDLTNAPVRGAADAPVSLVLFSDFQCGFCQRVNPTLLEVLEQYAGKVRIVFKHFPIEGHDAAPLAHRAAMAAHEQGKFWEMHDRIFANQRAMTRADLTAHAQALGLDMVKFTAAIDAERFTAILERDKKEAERAGIDGTPTFFVNGTPLVGAQPQAVFAAAIDKALAAGPAASAK